MSPFVAFKFHFIASISILKNQTNLQHSCIIYSCCEQLCTDLSMRADELTDLADWLTDQLTGAMKWLTDWLNGRIKWLAEYGGWQYTSLFSPCVRLHYEISGHRSSSYPEVCLYSNIRKTWQTVKVSSFIAIIVWANAPSQNRNSLTEEGGGITFSVLARFARHLFRLQKKSVI